MNFNIPKRIGEFGVFSNRREYHGEERVKAIDLPARMQVKPKELDMLLPTQGVKFSELMYGPDLRKPKLQTFVLNPVKIARKPEGLILTIYDSDTDKRRSMRFEEVTFKDPVLEFEEDGVIYLTGKFQIHPGDLFARISDNVETQSRQFECKSSRPELFDSPDDEEEGGVQVDIEEGEDGE